MATEEEVDLAEVLKEKYEQINKIELAREATAKAIDDSMGRQASKGVERLQQEERLAKAAKAAFELAQEKYTVEEKIAKLEKEKAAATRARKRQIKEELKQLEKIKTLTAEEIEKAGKLYEIRQRTLEQTKKKLQLSQNLADTAAGALGIARNLEDTTEGQIASMLMMEDRGQSLKDLGEAMKERFSLEKVGISLINKVSEATFALAMNTDKTTAAIAKATGEGSKYNDVLMESYYELRTLNIDVDDAGESIMALQANMAQFSKETAATQEELIVVTAQLQKLGISNAQTAETLNFLTKAMGQTSSQSAQTMRDLYGLAQALELPPEVVMTDFKQASAQLSVYGKNMQKEFASIAGAAKETGIEMGRLLTIAEQYDTFEGAATAVGRFNAMMGGPYLNAIEQLNATEEDRIRNMIRAMDASGKAFGSLDKYEQKAIAASVGITDMAEANKLFGQSLSAYDAAQQKAKLSAVSQEELAEATATALSVGEKFSALAKSLAIGLEPVIALVGLVADGLLAVSNFFGAGTGYTVLFVGAVLLVISAMRKAKPVIDAAGGYIKKLAGTASDAVESLGEGLGKGIAETAEQAGEGVGKGMEKAAKGAEKAKATVGIILAYGAAALMLGGGLYLAAKGFAEFAKSLENLSGGQLVAMGIGLALLTGVFVAFIVSIAALAKLGAIAAGIIILLGLGFLALGFGINLAAEGLALFVKNMEGSLKILTDWSAEQMMALGMLAFTMAAFGGAGAIGMLLFAAAVNVLAYALYGLDLEKLNSLSGLMEETAAFNKSVQKLTKEKADIAKDLFDAAAKYNITVVKSRSSDDVTDAANKLIAAMSTSKAQTGQALVANITIGPTKLNGRNLTKEIRREINTIAKPAGTGQ